MNRNDIWSAEKEQTLRDCIAAKMSAGKTAELMHITPGAANGKAHRMGLKFLSVAGHPGKRKKRQVNPRNYSNHTRFLAKAYVNDPGLKEVPMERPEYLGVSLRDLADNGCHYIAGNDRLYCGQPTDGESQYCGWCRKIMYQPMQLRHGRLTLVSNQ